MDNGAPSPVNSGLPEGFVAIPIDRSQADAVLRICVLVRQTPDPVAGHFVVLREHYDARVFLGCVRDASGRVREWLELWVQNVEGLEASLPSYREAFSNFSLDSRWMRQAEALRELDSAACLWTGWESRHPLPAFLDLSGPAPVHPAGPGGDHWELCLDDDALRRAGLPAYSTSLFRYWYRPHSDGQPEFVSATAQAPENAATRRLADATAGMDHHLAFNPQGGLITVIRFAPIAFDHYADLLGGASWPGLEYGKRRFLFTGVYPGLADWNQAKQDNAYLFLGLHGRAGRFIENYHLKLQLLLSALRQIRDYTRKQQLPLLNLAADSFRIALDDLGPGLPALWTAKCILVKPGHAFALPIDSSEFRYFIRPGKPGTSIYLPEGLSGQLQGLGAVRLRKVLPPDQGRCVLEGNLIPQEPVSASPHDLIWIRLPLPTGRLDLYAHLYAAESLAQGEIRFRTVAQRFPDAAISALRAAEGVSFARAPFEVVPLLSSPCDLYAFGVLAVRALLVDGRATMAVALDELLSLARQLATEHKPDTAPGVRVRAILDRDSRYLESLGPHRLTQEGITPQEAFQLLPPELWCDTLAWLVSLFPGMGPDSVCRDMGDVPALALDTLYQRPLEALEKLLLRSRSLVVSDWAFNREIQAAIQQCAPEA